MIFCASLRPILSLCARPKAEMPYMMPKLATLAILRWSEETFSQVRYVYPVLGLMEDMVISGIEHVMKPDHRIFELALKRFGIKADETVFIDDNPNNVKAACEVGIHGVLFQSCEQLKNLDF